MMAADTLAAPPVTGPVLLYDGACGFCNRLVQFILKHEIRHTLKFAALQGDFASRMKGRHPALDEVDSVIWLDTGEGEERVYVRSAAVFKVLGYLGGFWSLLRVGRLVPAFAWDFLYDWFARRRYAWFGSYDSCPIPEPEVRRRFVD